MVEYEVVLTVWRSCDIDICTCRVDMHYVVDNVCVLFAFLCAFFLIVVVVVSIIRLHINVTSGMRRLRLHLRLTCNLGHRGLAIILELIRRHHSILVTINDELLNFIRKHCQSFVL